MLHKLTRAEAKQEVMPGWAGLIDMLYDHVPAGVDVQQVKEKFGALRVYVGDTAVDCEPFLDALDALSMTICERCGELGCLVSMPSGWIKTLCSACAEDYGASVIPPLK